ncbi:RagB/SusD family nutrient uptake outer membrane protein [Pedobacter insulae]|uniref:SusD family protein n=1 Tax=Pedobacter insulae TaxID=414048 RepID=A0A1I2Z642_9SPHI|nr:RagB/SusD family nutrient uptake outer membrane protein [Pedobacter insulae]SFH33323.1 SusD family protein [Pedobacter insulae]
MKNTYIILIIATVLLCSCKKFLDEKSNSKLATPETLEDNQALLDRNFVLGLNTVSGQISAEDVYVSEADFNNMSQEAEKRIYTWQPDHVSLTEGNDWENTFRRINIFNTVLFNLENYQIPNSDNVKGQALVFRASAYLEAAQLWCLAYNKRSASSALGLPLRLDPDMNVPSVRSTLKQTYEQIISDLQAASNLLPATQISVIRPSKVTALGFLSRVYLYMGEYEKALQYGNEALSIYSQLLDYNVLNGSATYPIIAMNKEILLPTSMAYSAFLGSNQAKIAPDFYNSYENNDLRKELYFRKNAQGEILFRGNYTGSSTRSTALATDEVYLSVAESYAETNDLTMAMQTLNQLLIKRWRSGFFVPFTATTKEETLQIIKRERRKELLFRGIRWADLKRYNRDGANLHLTRVLNGITYQLPPNDLRYAIAIPEDIIKMTGMPQNRR